MTRENRNNFIYKEQNYPSR